MGYLAHEDDCSVVRDLERSPGKAVLMDCDGEVLFICDESWTDEQIFHALSFANEAYCNGFDSGQDVKALNIRRELGLK